MAWRCTGTSNTDLIEKLAASGLIRSERVKQAMLKVDRAHYAPSSPYRDAPQSIGHAATISAPHMHAAACEALLPFLVPGAAVLDVGSGSGYLSHVMAELVRPGGRVVGLEHIPALVRMAGSNTAKSEAGRRMLDDGGVRYVLGDGRRGWTGDGGESGWDAIHVGAAAAGWHQDLIDQLKAPGRMFIPVAEGQAQYIYVVDKDEQGNVVKRRDMGVQYVPLTDAPPSSSG
ncbi:hypothetical protein ANO11243_003940 [Dothideomycetidae sp. 11243]|nr:hypothetical protein ANO11243_003940 [fungal sp. No.11243]